MDVAIKKRFTINLRRLPTTRVCTAMAAADLGAGRSRSKRFSRNPEFAEWRASGFIEDVILDYPPLGQVGLDGPVAPPPRQPAINSGPIAAIDAAPVRVMATRISFSNRSSRLATPFSPPAARA